MSSYELKVGDLIKDNDPRMPNRVLQITAICTSSVWAKPVHGSGPSRGYLPKRIYTDGKSRKSGFSLVLEATP